MKDIKGNFVDCDARAITARGRKRTLLRRAATEKERETRGCRLIYAVTRDGKNYERNATSRRATPNLICRHPRPPLGFANKITLEDIGGRSGSRPATARLGAHPRWDFINPYLFLLAFEYIVSYTGISFSDYLRRLLYSGVKTENPVLTNKRCITVIEITSSKIKSSRFIRVNIMRKRDTEVCAHREYDG